MSGLFVSTLIVVRQSCTLVVLSRISWNCSDIKCDLAVTINNFQCELMIISYTFLTIGPWEQVDTPFWGRGEVGHATRHLEKKNVENQIDQILRIFFIFRKFLIMPIPFEDPAAARRERFVGFSRWSLSRYHRPVALPGGRTFSSGAQRKNKEKCIYERYIR